MRAGVILSIPDAAAQTKGGRVIATQPGLPGRWSVWSGAAGAPGSHFMVPADDEARATGIKFATVRITESPGERPKVRLDATEPPTAMPKLRRTPMGAAR